MPDANPRFQKLPRPETIEAFVKYVSNSKVVSNVIQVKPQLLIVTKTDGAPLKVHMTNIYIVGEADVAEILADEGEIDAIVTLSGWNSYSTRAKSICRNQGVGLFVFKEFLGAIYSSGQKFLDYIHPDDRR